MCVDLIQLLEAGAKEESPKERLEDKNADDEIATLQKEVKALESELAELKKKRAERPVAMSVRDEAEIGGTAIRVRGDVHQKGVVVPRGFLSIAYRTPVDFPSDQSGRIQLADWIVNPHNPMTARVIVNRVWAWMFGTGLVRTVDNFGTTGDTPSHPELLDYLATRFMENGWSTKWLVREIMMSRTWQLAGGENKQDIDNRWFTVANRRRLDAEQIRDAMLFV